VRFASVNSHTWTTTLILGLISCSLYFSAYEFSVYSHFQAGPLLLTYSDSRIVSNAEVVSNMTTDVGRHSRCYASKNFHNPVPLRSSRAIPVGSLPWILGVERRRVREFYITTGCRVETEPGNNEIIILKAETRESIELAWCQIRALVGKKVYTILQQVSYLL
jgi:hypothetical protein